MRLIVSALALLALGAAALAHGESGAGEPGDGARPARTIDVTAVEGNGGMSFTPGRVEVAKGEQVRFVVHNSGALTHEFVIGDRAENQAHAKMMAAMPEMKHHDANAVTIEPGKSATLLWKFSKAGAFEFACLIPGHYEAGMHGVVSVK